ncbi:MAG: hypothetical protein M9893_04700 [Pyrinomonadaceae bacterium]|nr:hypothetical protein [Pyrinomonadaceae bacterium]
MVPFTENTGFWTRFENSSAADLGDFTTKRRIIRISGLAIVIGTAAAGIAWLLRG